ncbi:PleD family two-component system response regulator [Candidatus Omnitrophota bacterium]
MGKKKVMIVDDEEHFLKIVKMNLEMTDKYEVVTLLGGENIISQVQKFKPDIILLDIIMPKIDGAELCKILKEDSKSAKIPIIALSAMDTDEDKLMMHKLGVIDFLIKPIDKDTLVAKIEKTLECK